MIVVDTTVWIDFLEARGTLHHLHLRELLREDAPVALTDMIYCEVLQGIVEEGTYRDFRDILRTYPILHVRGLETFEHAAQIYRARRKSGFTIRKTADCIVAATCLEAGADLYQNDRDLAIISKVRGCGSTAPRSPDAPTRLKGFAPGEISVLGSPRPPVPVAPSSLM